MVTAHDEPEVREGARISGCAGYLSKPISIELLESAINDAIKAAKPYGRRLVPQHHQK
jgi:DNA-binding NarL/FixJ family response regulator